MVDIKKCSGFGSQKHGRVGYVRQARMDPVADELVAYLSEGQRVTHLIVTILFLPQSPFFTATGR